MLSYCCRHGMQKSTPVSILVKVTMQTLAMLNSISGSVTVCLAELFTFVNWKLLLKFCIGWLKLIKPFQPTLMPVNQPNREFKWVSSKWNRKEFNQPQPKVDSSKTRPWCTVVCRTKKNNQGPCYAMILDTEARRKDSITVWIAVCFVDWSSERLVQHPG